MSAIAIALLVVLAIMAAGATCWAVVAASVRRQRARSTGQDRR